MSQHVAQDGVDFFMGYADRLRIQFFGGEPLLRFPLMKKIRDYAADKYAGRYSFSIFTNGVLINDDVLRFFEENRVSVVLSIDGPKHVQDLNRVFPSGKGTFNIVYPRLKDLDKERTRIRMTVTPNNVERMFDSIMFFYGLGFRDIQEEVDRFTKWPDDKIEALVHEYEKMSDFLVNRYSQGDFSWPNYERRVFPFASPLNRRRGRCGSTERMCSMDVNGDLYPCQKFIVNRRLRVGNVYDGFNEEQRKIVASYRLPDYLLETRGCKDCAYTGICFAGCIADNTILDTDNKQDCVFRKVHYQMYEGVYSRVQRLTQNRSRYDHSDLIEYKDRQGGCGGEVVCGGEGCGSESDVSCGGESCQEIDSGCGSE